MPILFKQLFRYRSNEARTPLEDFLTEILVEWLRIVTSSGLLPEVLSDLFQMPGERLPSQLVANKVEWETQHVIGPGHRGAGKRPDIVGRGADFFLIIENKVGTGFTEYEDETGYLDQLTMYDEYRKDRRERLGGILLITHFTLPPEHWNGVTVRWSDLSRYLRHHVDESNQAASHLFSAATTLGYFSEHFVEFLEENSMSGTRIDLDDIIALPAYERLTSGLKKLGEIASRTLQEEIRLVETSVLSEPHGGTSGDFGSPNFFGRIMTDDGKKAHDSMFVLWCGVISSPMYGVIRPDTNGIPDISAGMGVWASKSKMVSENGQNIIDGLVTDLNKLSNISWQTKTSQDPNSDDRVVCEVYARRSLIDVYRQADGGDWDDAVRDFFRMACQVLLPEMQKQESAIAKLYD